MVSTLAIVFMVISLLLSVGLPVGLMIFFYRKERISLKAVLVGALMFFMFQLVLRIPVLSFLQTQDWYISFVRQNTMNTLIAGIAIAFTAGLVETAGRYVGMRFLLRNILDRKNGIAYGIGHGGIEAVLLVGLSYVGNIIVSIMVNSGTLDSSLVSELLNSPPYLFLAAGLERVFAVLFHIAAALLVAYGIIFNKKMYILYSLLAHTLLDGMAVVAQIFKLPIWSIEIWIAVVGLLSLAYIIKSKKLFDQDMTIRSDVNS